MFRRKLFLPLVLAAVLCACARGASADPYVTVTNCEQVTVGGQAAVRLTLRMLAKSGFFFEVAVLPVRTTAYPDTCTVLDAAPPPGWTVYRQADGNVYFDGPGVPANQSLDGFQLTLNRSLCCKGFVFENGLLLDEPSTVVCFEGCLATPAAAATWGRVKAIYR